MERHDRRDANGNQWGGERDERRFRGGGYNGGRMSERMNWEREGGGRETSGDYGHYGQAERGQQRGQYDHNQQSRGQFGEQRGQFGEHEQQRGGWGGQSGGGQYGQSGQYSQPGGQSGQSGGGQYGSGQGWQDGRYGDQSGWGGYGHSGQERWGNERFGEHGQQGFGQGGQYGYSQYGANFGQQGGSEYGRPGHQRWSQGASYTPMSGTYGYGQGNQGDRGGFSDRNQSGFGQGFGSGSSMYGTNQPEHHRWGGGQGFGERFSERFGERRGKAPRTYQRGDERIRDEICERIARETDIDASEVDIQVQSGEVTLSGMVENRSCKRELEDIAETVFGVRDVHNNLKVNKGLFAELGEKLLGRDDQQAQQRTSGMGSTASGSGSTGSTSASGTTGGATTASGSRRSVT